ncbi:MAG: glycosyltransferase family 2 protein [Sporolactobacillus sp.]
MKAKVSVIINTLNEESNIKNCLESVKWADDIVIVDMHSDDNTVKIARQYTDRIFFYKRMGFSEPARKFALEQVKYEWVFVIDADEFLPHELKNYLINVTQDDKYDALLIPRKNFFFGSEMRGTGWAPSQDKQLRFFKKKYMSYSSEIHHFVHLNPKARLLNIRSENLFIIHFNYISVEQFLNKLNRYTTIEAEQTTDRKLTMSKIVKTVFEEFFNRYIRHNAYKDGVTGLSLVVLMVAYRVSTLLKAHIISKLDSNDIDATVKQKYNDIVAQELERYK